MKTYKLIINGEKYEAKVLEYSGSHAKISVNGSEYLIEIEDDSSVNIPKLALQEKAVPIAPALSSGIDMKSGAVKAPLPGVIVAIKVKEGDEVKQGQTILILEAMKMESEIAAPVSGKIAAINVKERSLVQEGDLLFTMDITASDATPPLRPKPERVTPTEVKAPVTKIEPIIRAPLPGMIMEVLVKPGDMVSEDTVVLVLEAMKMESDIRANMKGKVKRINVQKGTTVNDGDTLIELESRQ